jgi:acyl-coenzyme A thioesterase PaaI-like protein
MSPEETGHQLEDWQESVVAARLEKSPQSVMEMIPYADFIGAQVKIENDQLLYWLDKRPTNIGNPSLPALHGGVIGGFLELSAAIEIIYNLDIAVVPKVVDFSLDYLRAGRYKTVYAKCNVLRQGKKLINVTASAWQDDENTPIATARCHFLI